MKTRKTLYKAFLVLGLAMILVSLILRYLTNGISHDLFIRLFSAGFMPVLSGILPLSSARRLEKCPEAARAAHINLTDERNIAIDEKAAYVTFSISIELLMASLFVFTLLGNYALVAFILALYLVNAVIYFVLAAHFRKKM